MINGSEELLDVAFQYPALLGVILGDFACEIFESLHSFVRTLVQTAGIRVGNKLFIKVGIENSIDRMMQEPVSDRSFVDISRLGV